MKWASVLVVLAAGCGNSGEGLIDAAVGSSRVQRSCFLLTDSAIATEVSLSRALREDGFTRLEAINFAADGCDFGCGLDDFCFFDCLGCDIAIIDAVYDR